MEKEAFVACEDDGEDGLTWNEVMQCEVRLGVNMERRIKLYLQAKYVNASVPLPTMADFQEFDVNSDGILLFEEWQEKTDCEDD